MPVVLIESTRSARTPLPVLARQKNDQGIFSQPSLAPPFPSIDPLSTGTVKPGDTLTISGSHLDGASVLVRFTSSRLPAPRDVPVAAGATDKQVAVVVPNDPKFPAGTYTVMVVIDPSGEIRTTNEAPMQVLPNIMTPLPLTLPRGTGLVSVVLACSPDIAPDQHVSLLLGSREIPADPQGANAGEVSFTIPDALPGDYLVRLRVDGADSNLLVDRTAALPAFDQNQKVIITP